MFCFGKLKLVLTNYPAWVVIGTLVFLEIALLIIVMV